MILEPLLSALPTAAGSSYALFAYVLLTGAIVYVTLSQHRLKTIAKVIEARPPNDRLKLLAKEYNVTPREGLSAEEWIRSQRQMLIFWLALAFLVALVVIIVIATNEAMSRSADLERREALVTLWKQQQESYVGLFRAGTLSEAGYTTSAEYPRD